MNHRLFSLVLAGAITLTSASSQANLVFNLIPEPNTPQFAIDGFNAAANLWSSTLANNITINLQIGFAPLPTNVLGQAGSEFVERPYSQVLQALGSRATSSDDVSALAALQPGASFSRLINHTSNNPNGPNSATPYVDTMDRIGITTANAKALGLVGPSSATDGAIRFSSDFSFDFNRADGISSGQFDFIGVAAHEIGHVLGFISGVDDIDDLEGIYPGESFSSNLIDLFRYSTLSLASGIGYTDYTADTRAKYFSVDGGNTQVALFSTGVRYGDGRQASHWKDNLSIGLLDPTVARGELLNISNNDLRAFDVMGYTVVPEPASGILCGTGLLCIFLRLRRSKANREPIAPS